MTTTATGRDLGQTTLVVLSIVLLIVTTGWVVVPFLPATVWAAMLVIATWPMLQRVQRRLRGRRGLAVLVMTAALLLVFIIPLVAAIGVIVGNTDRMAAFVQNLAASSFPPAPTWVAGLPLVGRKIAASWQELAALPKEELAARAAPYTAAAVKWLIARAGGIGATLVQLLLIVGIAPILWINGETVAGAVTRFARRLGGERGAHAMVLAAQAIRAVALGVVVTALIQGLLAGLGLLVAGVPFAGILAAVALLTSIAQLGPAPVLIPSVIYLFWSGHPAWGTALGIWTVIVSVMDNVIRPFLIKQGANLPLLLILTGVLGGLIAFGVVGLFVGPVVLAVSYTLLGAWVHGDEAAPTAT
jgi:predicted PurR-regulated permease PerM